jgi:hypothetical protein
VAASAASLRDRYRDTLQAASAGAGAGRSRNGQGGAA